PEPRVDWRRLGVALVASFLLCAVLAAVLSPVVFAVGALIAAPLLIGLDVHLRRERPTDADT
ncbi:MAG: hypothetical protein ACRDGH_11420, partial [Candidatus Limnocylindria bacterium]